MAHSGSPKLSLLIMHHIHNDKMFVLRIVQLVVLHGLGINPTTTLTIGTYPDMTIFVFGYCHDSRRITVFQVTYQFIIGIKEINTVFISSNPCTLMTVDQDTDDTSWTDGVACA